MNAKKSLEYLGLLSLISIAALFSIFAIKQDETKQNQEPKCSNIEEDSAINSKRSLGLIIQDRLLLALRLDDEGNYSVPGGHIDFGETPEGSLSRELREEIGITTNSTDFEFFKVDCESKRNEKEKIFYYIVKSWEGNITTESSKDRLKWVDYSYEPSKKADTDLKLALYHLKEAGLID